MSKDSLKKQFKTKEFDIIDDKSEELRHDVGYYLVSFVYSGTAFPINLDSVIMRMNDKPNYLKICEILRKVYDVSSRGELAVLAVHHYPPYFFTGSDLQTIVLD